MKGEILQKKVMDYNDDCLLVAEMYYDGSDVPIIGPDKYWKKVIGYDERNNEILLSYFDTDGEPIVLEAGYSQVAQEYNKDNVLVRKVFLDGDGELVNCLAGYASCEQTVTKWRSPSKAAFYDKNGRELFSYHVDYNEYGQKVEEWLAGSDEAYLNHPSYGVARIKYFYDDNRLKVREEYYDEEGDPADLYGGTSGWESEYSDLGFETKRSNLRDRFEPAADDKGIVTAVFSYDELGRETERTFMDESGKEHNCVFGFSRYQVEYGDDGEIEKVTYWDENGEEVTSLDGEVEKVVLSLHNGDYQIKETEIGTFAFAPVTYNVNRIAYCQNGDYDLMLPYYIPFNVSDNVSEIIDAALKKSAKAFDGDTLNIKTVCDDGAEIEGLMDRYLEMLQEGGNVMELFGDMNIEAVIGILEPYADKIPTKAEIMDFYEEYYDSELENIRGQLQSEYGKEFTLSYRITDMNEFSDSLILAYNTALGRYNMDISIEDMITLEVEYMVKGNGKSDVLSDGFFYPRLTLLKFDGSWTLGTAEGFPAPDTKELAVLFGIEF